MAARVDARAQQDTKLPPPASTIISAGIGYLACKIFTAINPYAGAIFGAVSDTVDHITTPFFNLLEGGETATKTHKYAVKALKMLSNITISSYLTNYFIKFTAIEILKTTVATIALPYLAFAIIVGAILSVAVPIFAYKAFSHNR